MNKCKEFLPHAGDSPHQKVDPCIESYNICAYIMVLHNVNSLFSSFLNVVLYIVPEFMPFNSATSFPFANPS